MTAPSIDVKPARVASTDNSMQKTPVQLSRRSFLTALAASTFSTNAFGLNIFSIFRSDYKQVFQFSTEKSIYREPADLAKTWDGGYLCVANESFGDSTLLKIDALGKQQWMKAITASERGATQHFYGLVVSQSSHGYLAVGQSNSYDLVGHGWDGTNNHGMNLAGHPDSSPLAAMAMKFNDDGSIAWKKAFGLLEKHAFHSFQRCTAVADGYIVAGYQKLPKGNAGIDGSFPWILKLSEQGKIEWEVAIKSNNGKFIDVQDMIGYQMVRPMVNADGSIVMAFGIQDPRSRENPGGGENRRTLVLKFNASGEEIARYEATKGFATVLFPSGDGFEILIQKSNLSNFEGFHKLQFNSNLTLISNNYVKEGEFAPLCAVQGPGHSMHVAGVSIKSGTERPEVTVGLMQPNGEIQHRKFFGRQSSSVNLVSGDRNDEVVLAYWTTVTDTKITKLRLRN